MSVNVNDEIPQWAKELAYDISYPRWSNRTPEEKIRHVNLMEMSLAFARYIAQHEQPPVDPDLVKAREICARVYEACGLYASKSNCRDGKYDERPEVQFALSALKEARGQ